MKKLNHTEYCLVLVAVAVCVSVCFWLLVYLFQHIDPNMGGWIK